MLEHIADLTDRRKFIGQITAFPGILITGDNALIASAVIGITLFQHLLPHCLELTSDLGIYKTNRDLLLTELTRYGYEMAKPDGAFYLFLKSPEADDWAFCERAKQFEVMLVPGDCFGYPGYARLSYCVDTDTVRRALPALEALMKSYTE